MNELFVQSSLGSVVVHGYLPHILIFLLNHKHYRELLAGEWGRSKGMG